MEQDLLIPIRDCLVNHLTRLLLLPCIVPMFKKYPGWASRLRLPGSRQFQAHWGTPNRLWRAGRGQNTFLCNNNNSMKSDLVMFRPRQPLLGEDICQTANFWIPPRASPRLEPLRPLKNHITSGKNRRPNKPDLMLLKSITISNKVNSSSKNRQLFNQAPPGPPHRGTPEAL